MDQDPFEIKNQEVRELEDLPVCVCILETVGGYFFVGTSANARERYKQDVAAVYATSDAQNRLAKFRDRYNR